MHRLSGNHTQGGNIVFSHYKWQKMTIHGATEDCRDLSLITKASDYYSPLPLVSMVHGEEGNKLIAGWLVPIHNQLHRDIFHCNNGIFQMDVIFCAEAKPQKYHILTKINLKGT